MQNKLATLLAAATLFCGEQALASGAASANPVVGAREIANTGFSLLLVVAAIMALAWVYSRMQGARARNSGVIQVLAAQPLGAKERVMLVDVAGQHLVIGVTASQIQTLHVLDKPVVLDAEGEANPESFAARLKGLLPGTAR